MHKINWVLFSSLIFFVGCSSISYVQKPWAKISLEQAKAECDWESSKKTIDLNDSNESYNNSMELMQKCIKAKGWELTSNS